MKRLTLASAASLAFLLTVLPATAQDETASEAAQPAPPPAPTADDGQAALMAAYQKEYAFLEAQRADLASRLETLKARNTRQLAEMRQAIDRLENEVVGQTARADRLEDQVFESERLVEANEDNSQTLVATIQQAGATLEEQGIESLTGDDFDALDDGTKVEQLFTTASTLLTDLSSLREETGKFYLQDGTEVTGTILRVGNIAAYGQSSQGGGALAPAGGGRLKVWSESQPDTAQTLLSGTRPDTVDLFLFESLNSAINERQGKTIVGIINSGGTIGWVIVVLGMVALALIVLRAIFLKRAGSSTKKIIDEAGALVQRGQFEQALEACKRIGGAPARVVSAAIRNLDRDREHLEDIISESILHENSHLNRFGAFILVIAAVAPLLGLLGTVTGMISTFDIITEFGTGDPKLLSSGIAIALVTTELGLIVAIPTLLLGNVLSSWADSIKDDMEKAALRITNIHLRSVGSPEPTPAPNETVKAKAA